MKPNTARGTKNMYMTLGAIAVVMLLGSALVVPSSNAYAISQGGKGKSDDYSGFNFFFTLFGHNNNNGNGQTDDIKQDIKDIKDDRKEIKDKKEDNNKDKDKCKPNKHGKYNKDCREDNGGNSGNGGNGGHGHDE